MDMSAGQDVFAKVRGMIQEMIEKLVAEAAAEADHKAWCDKETADTVAKIEDHQNEVEDLNGQIDKAEAASAQLKESIAGTDRSLAEIAKQQADMTGNRQAEHEEFTQAKADLEAGIDGLTMALQTLRDYYAQGEAFLQQPAVGSHAASTGGAQGILGLLEVAQADFSKMLADAEAEEASAAEQYKKVSQQNSVDQATKQQDSKYEKKELAGLVRSLADLRQDRQGEQAELDAVVEYYSKVKPGCETKPMTFEERKQRRESEIAGLKEALTILESETESVGQSFLQRK